MLHVYARVLNDFYFRAKRGVGGWTKKVALAFLFISLSLSLSCCSSSTGLDWIDVLDRLGLRWGSRLYIFLLLVVHLLLLSLFSFLFRGREACIFSLPSTPPSSYTYTVCTVYIYRERRVSRALVPLWSFSIAAARALYLSGFHAGAVQTSSKFPAPENPSNIPPPQSPPSLSMCPDIAASKTFKNKK